eukprot:1191017-Prorocentrum_minimum.AAC.3
MMPHPAPTHPHTHLTKCQSTRNPRRAINVHTIALNVHTVLPLTSTQLPGNQFDTLRGESIIVATCGGRQAGVLQHTFSCTCGPHLSTSAPQHLSTSAAERTTRRAYSDNAIPRPTPRQHPTRGLTWGPAGRAVRDRYGLRPAAAGAFAQPTTVRGGVDTVGRRAGAGGAGGRGGTHTHLVLPAGLGGVEAGAGIHGGDVRVETRTDHRPHLSILTTVN